MKGGGRRGGVRVRARTHYILILNNDTYKWVDALKVLKRGRRWVAYEYIHAAES
jgi:hypothetical protein